MTEPPLSAEELAALDKAYQRKLAAMRREMRPDLDAVLSNPDGIARLLSISDEEWQAAQDADDEAQGDT